LHRSYSMEQELKSSIIKMAWSDRVTFEDIEKKTGLTEAEVIKVMRASLKPSSFRLWRKRVSGRKTKHHKLLKNDQDLRKKKSFRAADFDREGFLIND